MGLGWGKGAQPLFHSGSRLLLWAFGLSGTRDREQCEKGPMIMFYTLFSFPFYGLFLHVIKIPTFTLFRLPFGSKDCVMRSTNLCVGGSDALLTYKWWWHHLLNQIALEKVRRFYCVLYKEGVLYHSNKKKVLVSYWRKTVHSQTIVIEKWEV